MRPAVISVCVLAVFSTPTFPHETLTTTVLFDREIVRILNKHCVMCHAEGGPSFPLVTYEQTWLQKRPIRADVIARHMPPWAAVPGYGQFANNNGLTLRETQFIVSWVEGLGPRNSGTVFSNVAGAEAARPQEIRAHVDFGKWHLGTPDLTREIPTTIIESNTLYHVNRSSIDLGLTAPRQIRAVEFMPGDRRVVRAAFFTIQETGQWIGSWTPWYGFMSLPKGASYKLPAGAHITAEIHYRGVKDRVLDSGTLGLFFADPSAANPVSDLLLEVKGEVPAGTQHQRFRSETLVTRPTYAVALRPELPPGAKSIEVSAHKPDGGTVVLLYAKDFSTDWPSPYIFKEPVLIPPGSRLIATAYYGNSGSTAQAGGFRLTLSKYETNGPTRR